MQVNKNKVIVLPKSVKSKDYEFICPCPICTEKAHREEIKYINLQEVKNTIEDIIDSTSLYRKEFRIDISYTADTINEKLKDQALLVKLPEIEKIAQITTSLLQFTEQFNKNYRHPLICELRENMFVVASQVGGYIHNYEGKAITNQRLWDFQSVMSTFNGIIEILSDIKREEIFQNNKMELFLKRIAQTRKQSKQGLKMMFIQGLHTQEVQPHAGQQDFSLEYGY